MGPWIASWFWQSVFLLKRPEIHEDCQGRASNFHRMKEQSSHDHEPEASATSATAPKIKKPRCHLPPSACPANVPCTSSTEACGLRSRAGLAAYIDSFLEGRWGLVLGGLQVAISEATRQGGDHIATAGQAL